MIRVVAIYEDATEPIVDECPSWDEALFTASHWAQLPKLAGITLQVVTSWFPATWRQVLPGCEVLAPDGSTWVVARALSPASPHEVEIYRFGQPDKRSVFTPQYDQPVQARMTHEASMMALLVSELGARIIDDGS